MDLATLKKLKPAAYEDAADGYRATGEMAGKAKDAVDTRISSGMRAQLEGEAATAALNELKELSKNFHYVQTECGLVSTALNGFAHDMAAAKRKLDAAVADAQAAGCTVNPDGSVGFPSGGQAVDGKVPEGGTVKGSGGPTSPTADALYRQAANAHPNPNYGKALEFANRIADAVKEATDADAKWAPKLRALKADDDLTVSDRDWVDTQSDAGGVRDAGKGYLDSLPEPPKSGTPKDNAAWWKGLTPEEQSAYMSLNAAQVGALDGLPSATRDEANRMVFDQKYAQYRLELASIAKPPANGWTWITAGRFPSKVHTDEWMDWHKQYGERYEHLTKSLNGMDSIQKRFDQTETGPGGLPRAYLLGFSAEGNGRAIIANGNPDTADHQAVYVPGTTSNLSNIEGNVDRMVSTWHVADSEADGKSVSTITWLGYDAPQDIYKDAPFRHYADDGAPAFNRFLDGLEASHAGSSEAHRTVIGHSYGTTLVGSAADHGTLNADDVITVGSPGVTVARAEDLDVPKGHVWNQEADGDVVPDIGRWGHGGHEWRNYWVIPSDEGFGAHQLATDTEGHSDYWEEGSQSLRNQGLVVAGKYDDIKLK
ncbi:MULTISPECIES: alpha/beta hydrolase [Streptomyces]|uniref:Alpha/beta hydrolase family protein n=1 Tax=Streptomyces sudanensis TaxID=436397 RepID=A0ABY4TFJ2_9ACTN|nr:MULTISPECIES: alpha/beta hydrolase [Streptomyces]URN15572.1 alpha/beta hydrolase family protein [Streptomyces sudanensis]